jgi:hypothetical protein
LEVREPVRTSEPVIDYLADAQPDWIDTIAGQMIAFAPTNCAT